MDYKLKWPNVKGRKRINIDDVNYGIWKNWLSCYV